MKMLMALTLMTLLLPAFVLAQAPAGVHVTLPADGANYVQSTALSGTLSSRGITFSWDVQAQSAALKVSGTYGTEWISPNFNVYWFSTPENLPMSVEVISLTDSAYDYEAPFNTGEWQHTLDQLDVVGNLSAGHHYPACSRFDININPDVEGAPYDMAVTMNWGEGVAVSGENWDAIKAIYR